MGPREEMDEDTEVKRDGLANENKRRACFMDRLPLRDNSYHGRGRIRNHGINSEGVNVPVVWLHDPLAGFPSYTTRAHTGPYTAVRLATRPMRRPGLEAKGCEVAIRKGNVKHRASA